MGFFPSSSKTADHHPSSAAAKDLPIYSEDSLMFRLGFAALAASGSFPHLRTCAVRSDNSNHAAVCCRHEAAPARKLFSQQAAPLLAVEANALSLTDYGVGSGHKPVGIEVLVNAVPEIKQFAEISGEQVFNVGSSKLSIDNWLTLARRVNTLLADEHTDGIVITHGTDTLEETAYFLNLVVKSEKPVVLVGSMRPATGLSADGPLNLVNAVALAASKEAYGQGVMVIMNDQISSAFGVTKTNSTNVGTFKCPDTGYLGFMQNNKPYFFNAIQKRHTTQSEFFH